MDNNFLIDEVDDNQKKKFFFFYPMNSGVIPETRYHSHTLVFAPISVPSFFFFFKIAS